MHSVRRWSRGRFNQEALSHARTVKGDRCISGQDSGFRESGQACPGFRVKDRSGRYHQEVWTRGSVYRSRVESCVEVVCGFAEGWT